MMKWERIQGMKYKPYGCTACGSSPTKEDGSGPEDAYWAQAVDVNWGDSLLLCSSCVRVLGGLAGFLEPERAQILRDRNESLDQQLQLEKGQHAELKARVERMLDGARAKKEVQQKKKVKTNA